MTITELKTKQIYDLTGEQIEEVKKFLKTCSDREVMDYLFYVLDIEYTLSEDIKVNKAAEKFISDKQFNHLRDKMMKEIEESDDDIEDSEIINTLKDAIRLFSMDGWTDISDVGNYLQLKKIDYTNYPSLTDFITINVHNSEVVIDGDKRKCRIE